MRAATLLLAIPAGSLMAQAAPASFEFTIPNIMRGPEVYGREPQRPRFTQDGRWIYFSWLPPGSPWQASLKPYRVRAQAGARPEQVSREHMDSVGPELENGNLSRDGKRRVVSYNGDLYLIDVKTAAVRRLTDTPTITENNPSFSADGNTVYFVRDGMNLMALELAGPTIRQLTDVRPGPGPADSARRPPQRAALAEQQRNLFESVRDRLERDSIAKAEREARERVKTLYLRPNERVTGLSVSPAGTALVLTTTIQASGAERATIPTWVTASGYTEEMRVRTKVGDVQGGGRLAFMSLPKGELRWLGPIPGDSTATPSITALLGWNDAGTEALVFAERSDFKERYLHRLDGGDGTLRPIDTLRDSAWVGGPCYPCGGFLPGGNRVWFVSEASGFAHLYTANDDGSDRRQLTSGRWEVLDADLSSDRRFFELHTSEVSPFERHFYRMPIAGGPMERVTTQVGGHTVTVSPDGTTIADLYSTANRPPELYRGTLSPRRRRSPSSPPRPRRHG